MELNKLVEPQVDLMKPMIILDTIPAAPEEEKGPAVPSEAMELNKLVEPQVDLVKPNNISDMIALIPQ